mgnify:FL=1
MNPEHITQLKAFGDKVDLCMQDLVTHIDDEAERVKTIEHIIFGNENIGELGMKKKVDEMHEILMTLKNGRKGLLWIASLIAAIGVIVTIFKGGFWK